MFKRKYVSSVTGANSFKLESIITRGMSSSQLLTVGKHAECTGIWRHLSQWCDFVCLQHQWNIRPYSRNSCEMMRAKVCNPVFQIRLNISTSELHQADAEQCYGVRVCSVFGDILFLNTVMETCVHLIRKNCHKVFLCGYRVRSSLQCLKKVRDFCHKTTHIHTTAAMKKNFTDFFTVLLFYCFTHSLYSAAGKMHSYQ